MLNYRVGPEVWSQAASEILNPPQGIALPWWPKFTSLLGGLRPHELSLLCAPTGIGKTQLLAGISAQLLLERVPHFVAPVETGDTDYLARVASVLVKHDLNNGEKPPEAKFQEAQAKLAELMEQTPFTIATYDNRVDRDEMVNMLKYQHAAYGIRVALLDNLNFFLKVTSAANERAEMDETIHGFVMLAKKIPVHTILIVHPKKTEAGRVSNEFDLKGSSTSVQECANVMLYNRPLEEDVAAGRRLPTDRELVFRKIRKRGYNVGVPVWFAYNGGRLQEVR
jgi:hypothetical protein